MSCSNPIDHRAFLAKLPATAKAQLTARSPWRGLVHLTMHALLILILGLWVGFQLPLWGVAILPLGVTLVFLFTLEHECTHKTPFAQPRLNEWVGRACGLILILPFEWFRYFHLAHHRWTNIPSKDPELAEGRPKGAAAIALYLSGIPFWRSMIIQVIGAAKGAPQADYIPKTALRRIKSEARIMLAIYALLGLSLFITPLLLWVWVIPVLVGQPVLRLYLLAEHGDCPQVTNMFENTRTTFTTAIVQFLAWNMPYHAEHHIYPNVPFHNLPAFHQQVKTHLRVTASGYTEFTKQYLSHDDTGPLG